MTAHDVLSDACRVLTVCAHPDDESFGLGGVISTLVERGKSVDLVSLTRGEASTLGASVDLAHARRRELLAAADELGIGEVHLFDHPDGHLSTVDLDVLAADIRPLAVGSDLLLVYDEGGVTGHPDHDHATAGAMVVAERLDLPVLAWTLDAHVAELLNEEFDGGFVGRPGRDIDLRLPVDRDRQRAAMNRHQSQLAGNLVPGRRIALSGDTEPLRLLRTPDRPRPGSRHDQAATR